MLTVNLIVCTCLNYSCRRQYGMRVCFVFVCRVYCLHLPYVCLCVCFIVYVCRPDIQLRHSAVLCGSSDQHRKGEGERRSSVVTAL